MLLITALVPNTLFPMFMTHILHKTQSSQSRQGAHSDFIEIKVRSAGCPGGSHYADDCFDLSRLPRNTGLLLHSGGEEEHVWNTGLLLRHFLV